MDAKDTVKMNDIIKNSTTTLRQNTPRGRDFSGNEGKPCKCNRNIFGDGDLAPPPSH